MFVLLLFVLLLSFVFFRLLNVKQSSCFLYRLLHFRFYVFIFCFISKTKIEMTKKQLQLTLSSSRFYSNYREIRLVGIMY